MLLCGRCYTKAKATCTSQWNQVELQLKWQCWVNVPWSTPLKVCCKYTRSSTIMTFKCVIDSKHAIKASRIDWQSFWETGLRWPWCQKTVSHQQLNLRGGEEGWRDGGNHRGEHWQGVVYCHKCVQTQCYADRWRRKTLALQGKTKDAHRRRDTNNGSDTDLKRTHEHAHARAHQPEQLYPQRAGEEINVCWRRD